MSNTLFQGGEATPWLRACAHVVGLLIKAKTNNTFSLSAL